MPTAGGFPAAGQGISVLTLELANHGQVVSTGTAEAWGYPGQSGPPDFPITREPLTDPVSPNPETGSRPLRYKTHVACPTFPRFIPNLG